MTNRSTDRQTRETGRVGAQTDRQTNIRKKTDRKRESRIRGLVKLRG